MSLQNNLIYAQLGLLAVMAAGTLIWHFYRDKVLTRVRRQCTKSSGGFGKTMVFHSPDSVPRNFVQYGYRSNLCGTLCNYCWLVLPLAGYVVMMFGCYLAYVISDGIPFPGGADYWKDLFGSWNGLMLPWCVWFTIVHVTAGIASKFYTAMSAHSMLPCASMEDATHLIVDESIYVDPDDVEDPDETQGEDSSWLSKKLARLTHRVKRAKARQVMKIEEDSDGTRHVEYTCVRYIYSEEAQSFVPMGLIEANAQEAHAVLARGGLSDEVAAETLTACGENSIHVHVPGILEALGTEFSDFTYIFNSIGTWAYVAYSTWNIGFVWLIMMVGSGIYRALFIVRPNQRKIAEMASMKQKCTVLRENKWKDIDVSQITLGDIVRVADGNNAKLPCDGILLQGSLIVNESMLTGEPMPIAKAPVENNANYKVTDKLNKAYAGTLALESTGPGNGKSLLYCTNVGALTTRGQLVRMVLFPASVKFKYNDQLPIVYGIMSIYVGIIVLLLLTLSDIGSAVATYLTVLCTVAMALMLGSTTWRSCRVPRRFCYYACVCIHTTEFVKVTNHLPSYVPADPENPDWQPEAAKECLPPAGTLARIPLESTIISTGKGFKVVDNCIGPNNCYPWAFKWLLGGCILAYVVCHHGFVQLVLLGPVARALRSRQRQEDKRLLAEDTSSDGSTDDSV